MHPKNLSRRAFLAGALRTALVLQTGAAFAQEAASPPARTPALVRTPSGPLRGEQANGVRYFRGVPFAEPPVGPLRFRPPVPVKPWTRERDATRFPASAMQPGEGHSEDCLYLNVWAPAGKGPFPVFVWVHGGGFTGGDAFGPDGSQFAREGVLCVSVAYRLGVFGFLDLAPLLGTAYAGSANNGLRDLIAALQWIQGNIGAFGGDPSRVTVGGESAGAKLTDTLMGTPSARPLFHQMISESGGAERVWPLPAADAVAAGFAAAWKGQGGDPATVKMAPAAALIAAQQQFLGQWPQHFPLRGEVDGTLIPRLPVQTIAAGSTRGKRLLIGTNREESAVFIGPHPAHDPAASDLGNLSLARFGAVLPKYKDLYPRLTDERRRIRAVTAEEYWVPSVRVADAHVRGGGEAWMYRLDFAETSGRLQGYAFHSLDIGLAWDQPHTNVANAVAEAALAAQMHQAWLSFLRGESPAGSGLPVWPKYQPSTRPTMVFDTESRVEMQPQEAELRLWDGLL